MVAVVVAVVVAVGMAAEAEAEAVDAVALAATEDLRAVKPNLLSIRKRALRSLFRLRGLSPQKQRDQRVRAHLATPMAVDSRVKSDAFGQHIRAKEMLAWAK